MAFIIIGINPISNVSSDDWRGYTTLDSLGICYGKGIMKFININIASGSGSIKIKIFRDDGTNYVFVKDIPITVASGVNRISCWETIGYGDMIAVYCPTQYLNYTTGEGYTYKYKSGDITSNSLKTGWSDSAIRRSSFQGEVFTRVAPL